MQYEVYDISRRGKNLTKSGVTFNVVHISTIIGSNAVGDARFATAFIKLDIGDEGVFAVDTQWSIYKVITWLSSPTPQNVGIDERRPCKTEYVSSIISTKRTC